MKTIQLTALLLAIGSGAVSGQAAGYLKIGDIKGESVDIGHSEWIDLLSFGHGILEERDAASGLPTGKRQHKPFSITKPIDKASPLLMEACVTGRIIPMARLEFVRRGEPDHYYEVILKNVQVTSYETPAAPGDVPTEEFSLNYEEVKWTYTFWDDTDIVHVDQSYRWNLIREAGEADRLPAGSFRLGMIGAGGGTGGRVLMAEWEGFEEFGYVIMASSAVNGEYQPIMTHIPVEDGRQELELPIGLGNQFIRIEKIRKSILQQ